MQAVDILPQIEEGLGLDVKHVVSLNERRDHVALAWQWMQDHIATEDPTPKALNIAAKMSRVYDMPKQSHPTQAKSARFRSIRLALN